MNNLNSMLVLGMMLTVIFSGVAGVILFRFIPNRLALNQKRIVKQFMWYFSFAALAFVSYLVLPSIVPEVITVLANTLCYTVAIYMLRHGLLVRKHSEVNSLLQTPVFVANIVFTILVQYIGYTLSPENMTVRITILNINMIAVYLSCLKLVSGKSRGEVVVFYSILFSVILLILLSIPLYFSSMAEFYPFFVMSIQSILFVVWLGALFGLLLADSIQEHYLNSMTDAMTGLHNRRYFVEQTTRLLTDEQDSLGQQALSSAHLIICDIDNFKKINDTYGHSVGDKVICHVAKILKQVTRKDDVVARIGGEEFAIYLPLTSKQDAHTTAKRLQQMTHEQPCGDIQFTVSSGITSGSLTQHSDITALLDALLRDADRALYQAKRDGRDRICMVQPEGHILTMQVV